MSKYWRRKIPWASCPGFVLVKHEKQQQMKTENRDNLNKCLQYILGTFVKQLKITLTKDLPLRPGFFFKSFLDFYSWRSIDSLAIKANWRKSNGGSEILDLVQIEFYIFPPPARLRLHTDNKRQEIVPEMFFLANHFHLFGFPMEIQIKISVY